MAGRSWTVVVVPRGSDAPRTLEFTERGIKRTLWTVGGLLTVGIVAIAVMAIRLSTMPVFAAFLTPADKQLAELRSHMAELRDTIAIIDKRDAQIRLLAGLPDPDSGHLMAQLPLDVDTLISRANALSANFAAVSTTLSRNNARLS